MAEKFYRAADGRIVLRAIPSVGIEHVFSSAHMHGYRDNGFQKAGQEQIADDNIWEMFSMKAVDSHTNAQ